MILLHFGVNSPTHLSKKSHHGAPPSGVTLATAADAMTCANVAALGHSVSDGCYGYTIHWRDPTRFLHVFVSRFTPCSRVQTGPASVKKKMALM